MSVAFPGSCKWLVDVAGSAGKRAVLQSDSQKYQLHNHHQTSLQEKRQIEARSKPVKQSASRVELPSFDEEGV